MLPNLEAARARANLSPFQKWDIFSGVNSKKAPISSAVTLQRPHQVLLNGQMLRNHDGPLLLPRSNIM